MKLSEILNPSDRYEDYNNALSEDEVKKLLAGDYSDAWTSYLHDHAIYRGLHSSVGDIFQSNAHEVIRKSKGLDSNHYMELFSNYLDSWKDYPKRSNSIICSTSSRIAEQWADGGKTFVVFPKNDTNIATAPDVDFWFSFKKGLHKLTLDRLIPKIAEKLNVKSARSWIGNLRNLEEAIDDLIKNSNISLSKLLTLEIEGRTVLEHFDEHLSPSENGFKLSSKIPDQYGVEVWFSAPSLMINIREVDLFR